MRDKRRRSIAKTITWRSIATLITIGGVYVITGDLALSFGTGLVLNFIKAVGYYVHERVWEHIQWGRTR
jgi:uncharacterized membrane protein